MGIGKLELLAKQAKACRATKLQKSLTAWALRQEVTNFPETSAKEAINAIKPPWRQRRSGSDPQSSFLRLAKFLMEDESDRAVKKLIKEAWKNEH